MRNFIITLIVIGILVYVGVLYANKVKSNPQSSNDGIIDTGIQSNQSNEVIADSAVLAGDARHVYGDTSAKVTIVEFSDFQCPYCKVAAPIAKKIVDDNQGKVKLIFRQFPLTSIHQYAGFAAQVTEAVSAQNKDYFWKLHDLLFENQSSFSEDEILNLAAQAGANKDQVKSAIDSGKYSDIIKQDYQAGQNIGVQGTPTFYVNGRKADYSNLGDIVAQELKK